MSVWYTIYVDDKCRQISYSIRHKAYSNIKIRHSERSEESRKITDSEI